MLIVDQSDVRAQDTVTCIASTTGTAEGREAAWKFVKDHWAELHERYTGGFLLSRLVKVTDDITARRSLY